MKDGVADGGPFKQRRLKGRPGLVLVRLNVSALFGVQLKVSGRKQVLRV